MKFLLALAKDGPDSISVGFTKTQYTQYSYTPCPFAAVNAAWNAAKRGKSPV